MSELAGSMRALKVNDFPPLAAPGSNTIPEYDPVVDIAPGFAPTLNGPLAPAGQVIVPAPEPQQPRIYSVLEK